MSILQHFFSFLSGLPISSVTQAEMILRRYRKCAEKNSIYKKLGNSVNLERKREKAEKRHKEKISALKGSIQQDVTGIESRLK